MIILLMTKKKARIYCRKATVKQTVDAVVALARNLNEKDEALAGEFYYQLAPRLNALVRRWDRLRSK